MKELFDLCSESLGYGSIQASWGCKGSVLAAAGNKRQMVLFSKEGKEVQGFPLGGSSPGKGKAAVNAIAWNRKGASAPSCA
jgi:hypothetical protein